MTNNKIISFNTGKLSKLWEQRVIRLFVDVSDTIALPPLGSDVFKPHEIALREIVSEDSTAIKISSKKEFLDTAEKGYNLFSEIRRDQSVEISSRYKAWLDPFVGFLRKEHITELVKDWRLQPNFLDGINILRNNFGLPDNYPLEIVSGNLVNINVAFVTRTDVAEIFKDNSISFPADKIQGIKLNYTKEGTYDGSMLLNGELFYSNANSFPSNCLAIGDDAMKKYGFGPFLINVQSLDENLAKRVIEAKLLESSKRLYPLSANGFQVVTN